MLGYKRIILNSVATYARSLLALFLGLFSARWVLAALGKSDLGLFGVIGSIILCVQVLNIVMSTSVARYYAYAIGITSAMPKHEADHIIMQWFNAAISIHFVLPLVLLVVGYPIGVWVIQNWLSIPHGRIYASLWVFRLSLVSAFVAMITVPYIAMYRARQLIAELTIWETVRNMITFAGSFILLSVEGDRLIIYAAIMSLSLITILVIQTCRAYIQFLSCRIHVGMLFDMKKIRQMMTFGLCDLVPSIGCIVRDHGAAFLINKTFGSVVNSAYSIALQISAQTNSLANAMNGALMPAIATSEGAGRHGQAVELAHRSCKFCTLLVLVFAIPLFWEIDEVLHLWLVDPPEHTSALCRSVLLAAVFFKLGWGYHMAIMADGRIVGYQITIGAISIMTLPVLAMIVHVCGVNGVGYALAGNALVLSLVRVGFAKWLLDIRIGYWVAKIFCPIACATGIASAFGGLSVLCFRVSLCRLLFTSIITGSALLITAMMIVIDRNERSFLYIRVKSICGRCRKGAINR